VIDVNLKDKRGITPLHYSIEKQDYDMFQELLYDPYIDPFAVDSDFMRPRRLTVIFSAFHKMLYSREKIYMRRKFCQDLVKDFVDFQNS
jgi:ankyrin repeat protein